MKRNVLNIASEISRLDEAELSELEAILLKEFCICATMYRFNGIPSDKHAANGFDVKLVSVPRHSLLRAVKITKELLGLGLKDAKYIVDSRPCKLKEFATWEEAEVLLRAFEEIDAEIEINPVGK